MKMEELTFVLTEVENFEGISAPLRTTKRIKYSCFTASNNYLVFGATSGGLYVFKRSNGHFMYLLPNKEGAVTHILVSPDEKWFGFATSKGLSCIVEHHIGSVNRRIVSCEHEGVLVTTLQWNTSSSHLYVGDELGRISVISNSSFLVPTVTLMQLDSQIVQLDCCSHLLLASSLTRCYLCDTYREQYRQIGSRARDGRFGGCFYSVFFDECSSLSSNEINQQRRGVNGPYSSLLDSEWNPMDDHLRSVKLFCTRPGLRLWEVHVDGTVQSTHQFKRLLITPPTNVIRPSSCTDGLFDLSESTIASQTFNFSTLHRVASKFLFTFHTNGIYILDPLAGDVVLWTNSFQGIRNVFAVGDTIYVWMDDFQLHAIKLIALDQLLVNLYMQKQYSFCASICATYADILLGQITSSSKLHVLVDLLERLKEDGTCIDDTLLTKVSHLLTEISKHVRGQQHVQVLNSGIIVIGNAHLLSQEENMQRLKSAKLRLTSVSKAESQNQIISPKFWEEKKEVDMIPPDVSDARHQICNLNMDYSEDARNPIIEDFDPFPDLPLSALTSPETIAALKQISSSVTETITNGTKSLKEKWHFLEEKLRASEPNSCVEEMVNTSINGEYAVSAERDRNQGLDSYTGHDKENHPTPLEIDVSSIESLCWQISGLETNEDVDHQDLLYNFLTSIAVCLYRYQRLPVQQEAAIIGNIEEIMTNLFEQESHSSFPFEDYFTKETIFQLQEHFHTCLKNGILVNWLRRYVPVKTIDNAYQPSFLKDIFSEEDLCLDQALGRFLLLCRFLLDPCNILESLDSSQAICQHYSWNVVMDHFEKTPLLDSSCSELGKWPLTRRLNALSVVLKLGQTESSCNLGVLVSIKHVWRLMLRMNGEPCKLYEMFLTYLDKLPVQRLQNEILDAEILFYLKLAFKDLRQENYQSHCDCGFPIKKCDYPSKYCQVGYALLVHLWQSNDKLPAFLLCQKYGLWSQLFSLRCDEGIKEVLPLILQVGSISELKARSVEVSDAVWECIFKLRECLQNGICLGCNAKFEMSKMPFPIPWSDLAALLIQETTAAFALDLLTKFSPAIPKGSIDLRFYRSCLLSIFGEKKKKGFGKVLINTLIYSSNVPCLSPELSEQVGTITRKSSSHDRIHHWGMRLKPSESSCMCCLLPLNTPKLLQGWGIIGFQCGHAFHCVCLLQSLIYNCPICTQLK